MFKYNIGDIFKFGIMEDVIVAYEVLNGENVYSLETTAGVIYKETEAHLDNLGIRGYLVPAVISTISGPIYPQLGSVIAYSNDHDYDDLYCYGQKNCGVCAYCIRKKKEDTCTCDSKDLFNYGCKCGYADRNKQS